MGRESAFGWLHLSDIHIGHGGASHVADQELVLGALVRDLQKQMEDGAPSPDVILVTGDISFSGATVAEDEFERAAKWLTMIAGSVGLTMNEVYVVPGNHDVQRAVDKPMLANALLRHVRAEAAALDEVLRGDERRLLAARMANYLSFATQCAAPCRAATAGTPAPLYWTHEIEARSGIRVRLLGLNSALLAADDGFGGDQGKLRIGRRQLADLIPVEAPAKGEVRVVLSHHPAREGWLADEKELLARVRSTTHIHLSGHVHEAASEGARGGAGTDFVQVAAGAVHGEAPPKGAPPLHGYNLAALVVAKSKVELQVRPRRWEATLNGFARDTSCAPEKDGVARHTLARVELPVTVRPPRPKQTARPSAQPAAARVRARSTPRPSSQPAAAPPPPPSAEESDDNALVDQMNNLLPPQFEMLLVKLAVNVAMLSPSTTAQGLRSIELLRLMRQRERGVRLLRDTLRAIHKSPLPPPARKSKEPREPSDFPPVDQSVATAEQQLTASLAAHPRVLIPFTTQKFGSDPRSVAHAILRVKSPHTVMAAITSALNVLDADSDADDADHDALNRIFRECLRLSVDWQALAQSCREALARGDGAFELPTKMRPVAEVIVAAINDGQPDFDLSRGPPVGMTAVELPAVLRAPIMPTPEIYRTAVVKHLLDTTFRERSDLDHLRANPSSDDAAEELDGVLRAKGIEGAGGRRLPYYLVLSDSQGSALWGIATGVQKSEIGPRSLQVVMLRGPGKGHGSDDSALREHINTFVQRQANRSALAATEKKKP